MSAIKIEKDNTNLKRTKREVKYFASVFLSLVQIYNNLKQSNDVIELDMVLQTTEECPGATSIDKIALFWPKRFMEMPVVSNSRINLILYPAATIPVFVCFVAKYDLIIRIVSARHKMTKLTWQKSSSLTTRTSEMLGRPGMHGMLL